MLILFLCKAAIFLFAAIPVSVMLLSAWNAARSPRLRPSEQVLLATAYGTALTLVSVGLPGMLGCLSVYSVEICCLALSIGLYWIVRRMRSGNTGAASKPTALPEWCRGEKFFFGTLLYGVAILCLSCLAAHLGTDTFFYHLFFPAMWLENGSMAYVPIPGYTCEYYPAYGEMLFCFLMAPMQGAADFACLLQPAALVLNAVAVYGMGAFFGASKTASLAAAAMAMFTSMVFGNAAMAYTDVLNGGVLTAGIALLCIGVSRRHMPSSLGAGILLGVAASIKLTGLLLSPVLALAAMACFFCRSRKNRRYVTAAAAAAFLFASPFYLRSWIVTGNPFYPVRIPPFFTSGLEFERSAVGFTGDAWGFFFDGGAWGMNLTSGIVWGLAPFAVLAASLLRRRFRKRGLAVTLAVTLTGLFAVQLMVYPAIAQARQYIPWIMTASLLLPVALAPAAKRFPRVFPAAVLLLMWGVYRSPVTAEYGYVLIPLSGAALMFVPDRWMRRLLYAAAVLFLPAGAFVSAMRESDPAIMVLVFGPGPAECIRQVITASDREGPKTTAATGTKFSYGFMEDAPGNRVVSVPINKKGSLHPHEFDSLAEMRADPVTADEWIARLDAAGADYLYVEISEETERLPDPDWEYRTASSRPDRFQPLYKDETCALFQIVKKQ